MPVYKWGEGLTLPTIYDELKSFTTADFDYLLRKVAQGPPLGKSFITMAKNAKSSLAPTSTEALATLTEPAVGSQDRGSWVKSRLIFISREASERYFENGIRLQEIKDKKYWKDWGEYESFNDAIDSLHEAGQLEYGSRNARHFIAVVEMQQKLGIPIGDVIKLPISKLREICTVPAKMQMKLLSAAPDMTVSEVQEETKKLRHKAKGHDVDPLTPITLMMTASMKQMFKDCIKKAKQVYAVNEDTPDVAVLVDMILPEWFNMTPQIEAEAIETEAA